MKCSFCDGVGFFDADFDYDAGRYVPYGKCDECDGSGLVEDLVNDSGKESK